MDDNITLQKKLIDKIVMNISEHELRNKVSGEKRTYSDIYSDINNTIEFASIAHKGQWRKSGEPYLFHPLTVALIAAENGMVDKISIDGCLLHDVIEDGGISRLELSSLFGEEVADIVEGLTKIKAHKDQSYDKLFSHTISNPRVAYIKIFDRLHNLRTLQAHKYEKQAAIATESMDIFYKLCIRLCLTDIANELERLCAPILFPIKFPVFSARLLQIQEQAPPVVDTFKMNILEKCYENDVRIKKIRIQWKPFLEMDDYSFMQTPNVLLFKLVVDSIENAYKIIWLINTSYKAAGNIEDNISVPKFNNFRGISYTVVVDGIKIPLLITTERFNEFNRKGILVYGSFSQDIAINRKLMEHLQEYLVSESNFLDVKTLISFIDKDEMRVFAKDGKTIVDLKKGSTVLDFAFKIHSDIGLRADYGVVDGVRVGLGHELSNGNVVHVYTKNTITATEEALKKCITPRSHRVLKKYFENYHVELLFSLATQYIMSILSRYNVQADRFWLKMRERYASEKEIIERVIDVLRSVTETGKLLSELQLIDKEFMTPSQKIGDSFSKVWNIFSSNQKEVLMELTFLDEYYLFCPFCVPVLSDSHHKGILHETQFAVHTRDCKIAKNYDHDSIFSVVLRKDIKIDDLIYMRIETEDVSGITYAISSVFRSLNLEIFNVENDRTNALYRLAFYQKDPLAISSYLEKLRKIQEIRNIVISKKNVFGMQPRKILKWGPAGIARES